MGQGIPGDDEQGWLASNVLPPGDTDCDPMMISAPFFFLISLHLHLFLD